MVTLAFLLMSAAVLVCVAFHDMRQLDARLEQLESTRAPDRSTVR